MREEEVMFPAGTTRLAGTFCTPSTHLPRAAVILLAGSGHHDRDQTIGALKPFAVIAAHLAAHGIASLRFDGRGAGASGGSTTEVDFDSKVADALAARRWLIGKVGMSGDHVAFVGHSEGGLVGAAASARQPTALVMLAGPAQPIAEILHGLAQSQSAAGGATSAQIAHERQMNEAVFDSLASTVPPDRDRLVQLIGDYLACWPGHDDNSPGERLDAAGLMADTLMAPDFHSLLQQRPADILAGVTAPLFALFGGLDCQVPAEPNLAAFRAATAGNAQAHATLLPGHNHLFQLARTGLIDEYETLGQSPSPDALAAMTGWLRSSLAA